MSSPHMLLPAGIPVPLRVLIVEDCEPDLVTFARLLRRAFGQQVQVFEAEDARTALAIVQHEQIDVALVDYMLPDMDGIRLIAQIAAASPESATLVLTGQGNERVAAGAIKGGAHDYLIKRDIDQEALARAVVQAAQSARLAQRASQSMQQVQQAHADLDKFVRTLSHDMSANFMVLEHCVRHLHDSCPDDVEPRLTGDLVNVEACLQESKRLLDDLKMLSQTGQLDMEPAEVALASAIQDVTLEQSELLQQRLVEVVVEPGLSSVWCNEKRLKQILTNLLRNAVKHGCDPRRPVITISPSSTREPCEQPDFVGICMHDNGCGIPAEFREEIFLPGRRVPGTKADGTGLGLAIVRQIVTHYGGEVFVDPTCTRGTAIVFSLPKPLRICRAPRFARATATLLSDMPMVAE